MGERGGASNSRAQSLDRPGVRLGPPCRQSHISPDVGQLATKNHAADEERPRTQGYAWATPGRRGTKIGASGPIDEESQRDSLQAGCGRQWAASAQNRATDPPDSAPSLYTRTPWATRFAHEDCLAKMEEQQSQHGRVLGAQKASLPPDPMQTLDTASHLASTTTREMRAVLRRASSCPPDGLASWLPHCCALPRCAYYRPPVTTRDRAGVESP